jgi:SHS2 domain-containing protein
MDYEILEHTADLKIRAYGKDLPELFSHLLRGMFESCQPNLIDETPAVSREVAIKSSNLESLLVDFLSEALYLSDVNNEAYFETKFEKLTETELVGKIKGRKVRNFGLEIKAVTWHELEIKKEGDSWQATVIFDV